MARITVEDCLTKETNRFALVLLAAKRTKQILQGSKVLTKEASDNKQVVTALREIAEGRVRFMSGEEAKIARELGLATEPPPMERAFGEPVNGQNGGQQHGGSRIVAPPDADRIFGAPKSDLFDGGEESSKKAVREDSEDEDMDEVEDLDEDGEAEDFENEDADDEEDDQDQDEEAGDSDESSKGGGGEPEAA